MGIFEAADGRKLEFPDDVPESEIGHAFDVDMHYRIKEAADKYGVPAPLALGVAQTESGGRQVGPDGNLLANPESSAHGVFQLTKAARKDVGLDDNAGVDAHIDGGVRYLKMMYEQNNGDWDKAIESYKQGAGSIHSHGPDAETQAYKQKVYTWGQKLGAGALKLGGAAVGGIGGGLAGLGAGAVGAPIGAGLGGAWGYSLGKNLAGQAGLEPEAGLGENLLESARVGAGVAGGAAGGPLGFAGADTAAKVIQDKIASGGQNETLAPSETKIFGSQPFNFPGGELAQNAVVDLGADLGLRGLMKGAQGYSGYKAAKGATETALKGADEQLAAEQEAYRPKAEQAVGEQQVKQGYQDQAYTDESTQALEAARRQTQVQEGPAQAQRQFEAMVGPKPGDRVIDPADGGVPSDAATAARVRQAQAVFAPQRRIQDAMGKEYENLLRPHGDNPVDVNGLTRDTAAQRIQLQEWGKEGDLSREAQELLGDAQGLANRQNPVGGLQPATMRDLMNLRSRASQLFANGATPLDQSVGGRVVDNTLRAMEQGGFETQALRAVNAKYKFFRDSFDGVNRQVSKGMDPGDWGKRVFTSPDASVRLWDAAQPSERDQLRTALGEYLYSRKNMRNALNEVGPETLGRYFGDTPLSNARIWMETEPRLVEADRLLSESPEARQAFTENFNKRMAVIQSERDKKVVTDALALAKKLGPAGKDIQRQLFDAPQAQKGQIAQEFIESINPDKAVEDFASSQKPPSELAIKALGNISTGGYSRVLKNIAIRNGSIVAGEMLLRGHPGLFSVGAAIHAASQLPSTIMKESFLNALHNPKFAAQFIKIVNSGQVEEYGKLIADTAVAVQDAQQKEKK